MRELNGHRSVGGIRASIFNAISLEEVEMLVDHMKVFAREHRHEIHKGHHPREIYHHVKHEEQIHIKA
jgi:hypothetical protein